MSALEKYPAKKAYIQLRLFAESDVRKAFAQDPSKVPREWLAEFFQPLRTSSWRLRDRLSRLPNGCRKIVLNFVDPSSVLLDSLSQLPENCRNNVLEFVKCSTTPIPARARINSPQLKLKERCPASIVIEYFEAKWEYELTVLHGENSAEVLRVKQENNTLMEEVVKAAKTETLAVWENIIQSNELVKIWRHVILKGKHRAFNVAHKFTLSTWVSQIYRNFLES